MYTPAHFRLDEPDASAHLLAEHPFASLIVAGPDGVEASQLPLLLDRERGVLLGHLARSNPLAGVLAEGNPALALFAGPHAYVSPRWYADAGVPTWNYLAVQVQGRARELAGEAALDCLARLTAAFEDGPAPWMPAELPPGRLEAMCRALYVFELGIERIEAQAKLGQNRSAADQAGVRAALAARGEALAGWMRD